MPTDTERREVARRLRELDYADLQESLICAYLDALGIEGYADWVGIAHRLADLVEPHRGSGGRTILCAHCESASWCGCEPGDGEGGCDFEPSVTEGEPPYNLYSLYEAVLRRRPRDEYAIDDDEVEELVDALLDICNAPGHDVIQRPQPSCDREALLALADDMERAAPDYSLWEVCEGTDRNITDEVADFARRIREACGVVDAG